MKTGINLAHEKTNSGERTRKILIISLVIFSLSIIFGVGLILYNLSLRAQVSSTKDEVERVRQNIDSLTSSKARALAIKDRLGSIKEIRNSRSDINQKVNAIVTILPQGVAVDDLETSQQEITIRVKADNLSLLNGLLKENIDTYAKDKNNNVSRVTLSSFGRDIADGQYAANFIITYK